MKLSKEERSWAFYDWANSAYSITVTTAFFPMAFAQIAEAGGLSGSEITAKWTFANAGYALAMALLAPLLGTISDYKGYKKKLFAVFFLLGTLATAAFFFLKLGSWQFALTLYILSAVGLAGSVVFNDALLVDVTQDSRMDRLSSLAWGLGYLGGLIPFVIGSALIFFVFRINPDGSLPLAGMRAAFVLTALWWFVFTLPFLKNVKQKYGVKPEKGVIIHSVRRLAATFKNAAQYKKPFLFLLAYFFYIDGVGTIFKVASDFARMAGVNNIMLLAVLLAVQLIAFPFTVAAGRLSVKIKTKRLLSAGIGVYIAITLIGIYVSTLDGGPLVFPLFCAMSVLVGAAQGGIQALSRSYFSQIVPKEKAGEFFGLYDIFAKFAAILGPVFIGLGARFFGGYTVGLSGLLVLFVAGLVLLEKADKEKNA